MYVHYWPLYYFHVIATFAWAYYAQTKYHGALPLQCTKTMTLQDKVGKAIVQLRKARGISQETFAFEAGIDRRYMSDIENGKRNISLDILERVCQQLGIKISEFFGVVEKIEE